MQTFLYTYKISDCEQTLIIMLTAFVFTSVTFWFGGCVHIFGFDEFVPVCDCDCAEVADGAKAEDWLCDALIQG